jgi:hypothetical protein
MIYMLLLVQFVSFIFKKSNYSKSLPKVCQKYSKHSDTIPSVSVDIIKWYRLSLTCFLIFFMIHRFPLQKIELCPTIPRISLYFMSFLTYLLEFINGISSSLLLLTSWLIFILIHWFDL